MQRKRFTKIKKIIAVQGLTFMLILTQFHPIYAASLIYTEEKDIIKQLPITIGTYMTTAHDSREDIINQYLTEKSENINISDQTITPVMEIKLSHSNLTLIMGDTYGLTFTGTSDNITWSSNNDKIATVNNKGLITANAIGIATITGSINGKSYICNVTIKKQLSDEQTFVIGNMKFTIIKEAATSKSGSVSIGASNKNIKSFTIPEIIKYKGKTYNVVAISQNGFINCNKLKVVNSEAKVANNPNLKVIGDSAFVGCSVLEKVNIDTRNLTTIKKYAFYNCKNLRAVGVAFPGYDHKIPYIELTTIEQYAFFQCNKFSFYVAQAIGGDATQVRTNADDIVYSVGQYAFYCCDNLQFALISSNVDKYAYYNCDKLEGISTSGIIGEYAFAECNSLNELYLDGSIGKYAFYNCTNLEYVGVSPLKYISGKIKVDFDTSLLNTNITMIEMLIGGTTDRNYELESKMEETDIYKYGERIKCKLQFHYFKSM